MVGKNPAEVPAVRRRAGRRFERIGEGIAVDDNILRGGFWNIEGRAADGSACVKEVDYRRSCGRQKPHHSSMLLFQPWLAWCSAL